MLPRIMILRKAISATISDLFENLYISIIYVLLSFATNFATTILDKNTHRIVIGELSIMLLCAAIRLALSTGISRGTT